MLLKKKGWNAHEFIHSSHCRHTSESWCGSSCLVNSGEELKENSWWTFISHWSGNAGWCRHPSIFILLQGILESSNLKNTGHITKKPKNGLHNYPFGIILCGPICTSYNHFFVPVSVEKLYLPFPQMALPLTIYKILETDWYQPLKIHKAVIFDIWELYPEDACSGEEMPPCITPYAV